MREDHLAVPEQPRECESVEPVGLRDGLAGDRAVPEDLEHRHLNLPAGERVHVDRGRQANDPDDVLGGRQIRTDHEVDPERRLGFSQVLRYSTLFVRAIVKGSASAVAVPQATRLVRSSSVLAIIMSADSMSASRRTAEWVPSPVRVITSSP